MEYQISPDGISGIVLIRVYFFFISIDYCFLILIISTVEEFQKKAEECFVNALHRAIIISRDLVRAIIPLRGACQCPVSGNHHFQGYKIFSSVSHYCVSMPCIGQSSFPVTIFHSSQGGILCRVNALYRAIIISRKSSWKRNQLQCVSMPCIGQSSFPG